MSDYAYVTRSSLMGALKMISAEIVLGDGDAALELVVGLQTLIAEDVAMAERTALVDAYGDPIVMQ